MNNLPPALAKMISAYTGASPEAMAGATVSRWTSITVEGVQYPFLLSAQLDGKYVATVYDPSVMGSAKLTKPDHYGRVHIDRAETLASLEKPGLYWRGESFTGWQEALANAAAAMGPSQVEEGV